MSPFDCALTTDQLLVQSALRHPHKTAVVAGGVDYSYGVLDSAASRMARVLLRRGAPKRVAVILPNGLEWMAACFGAAKAGAALVPLNPAYTDRELGYILKDAAVELVICGSSHTGRVRALMTDRPALREVIEIDGVDGLEDLLAGVSDAAIAGPPGDWNRTHSILYTSGTTGQPKGAVLSHRARILNTLSCQLGCGITPQTRLNCPIPLFHSGGMTLFMMTAIAAGATLILPSDAGPEATIASMRDHGANYLAAVPTIISRLVNSGAFMDFAATRQFGLNHGGSPMPPALAEQMLRTLPGCAPCQTYGATEAPQVLSLRQDEYRDFPSVTGRPLPGVDVRVVDANGDAAAPGTVGEIVTAGPHLFDGYLNAPEKTAKALRDGVFWTGDLGALDAHGFITLVGRNSEVIISGGLNVYAREVEDVLHRHPQVLHAAVFAVPDQEWVETIGVAVIRRPGATLGEAALLEYCRAELAPYKKPRHIWFVEAFPLTPAGKVRKFELVRQLAPERFPDA